MVRIPVYQQQVALQPTSTEAPAVSNAVANELQNFGGAVQDAAAKLIEINQQKENFRAENDYRRLKLDLQNELDNRAQSIDEGGMGFHDAFLSDVYRPKRDEFLVKVPERLRPQFEAILNDDSGADAADWSIRAATVERDEGYRWQKQEITSAQENFANAISMSPDAFDAYVQEGQALIDVSSLPTPEKAKLTEDWRNIAQTAYLNQLLVDDPQRVLRELGVDARQLSPETQFAILSRNVQWQESRDNPNAVSGKGAVGLMQVMPSTAVEIAGEIGDANFPTNGSAEAIFDYLSNPYVNKQYGEHYLRKQLRTFASTRNPMETALVAYNAGPKVAKAWVESGYDDSVLSAETRAYKRDIMSKMEAPIAKGDPRKVRFEGASTDGTNTELLERVRHSFATLGLDKVRVNSAARDEVHNKEVGGADESQHLKGNALDINVSGMSHAERIELIKSLSAAGVTGIGVYANAIHADLGGRRAWGPDHGSGSVPKWAAGVIADHLAGTAPPPRAIGSRLAGIRYDTKEAFRTKADQEISRQQVAANKASAADKVTVRRQMDNELALIRKTGVGSNSFDETAVSTILGEDDYLTYSYKKDVAQRTFTATQGIYEMTPEEMEQRYKDYEPIPGSGDFAAQQEVQAAVRKEVEKITTLRGRNPDQAALLYPEVAEAYDKLASAPQGEATGEDMREFVRLMLEKQSEFNIKPEAQAPVTHDMAVQIGRALTRIPEVRPGSSIVDQQAAIVAQYMSLQEVFGDYTDEVLTYALAEYKGLSKPLANRLTAAIVEMQNGVGIFRPKMLDQASDQNDVEIFSRQMLPGHPFTYVLDLPANLSRLFGGGNRGTPEPEAMPRQIDEPEE